MKNYDRFRWLLAGTTALSACVLEVSRGVFDSRVVLGLTFIYGVSIFLRDHLYLDELTFFDYDHRELARPKEDLIVFGNRIQNLSSQSRERQVLMGLSQTHGARIKVYLAWIAMAGIAVWLHHRTHGVIFSETLGSVLMVSGIFFSPFLGQMLLPAYLSLGLVGFALFQNRAPLTVMAAGAYLIAFFLTLILFREIDADRANPKRVTTWPRPVRSAVLWSALFLVAFWFFDLLIPEPQAQESVEVERPKMSRELAEQVMKWQDRVSQDQVSKESPKQDLPSSGVASKDSPSETPSTTAQKSPSEDLAPESGRPSDGPMKIPEGFGDKKFPSGRGDLPQSNGPMAAEPQPNGTPLSELPDRKGPTQDFAKTQNPSQGPSDETVPKASATTSPGPEGSPKSESTGQEKEAIADTATGTATDNGTAKGADRSGRAETGKPSDGGSNKVAEKTTDSKTPAKPLDRESRLKEIEKKVELPLEITKGFLAIIGVVVVIMVLAKYFSGRKEDPEKDIRIQQLSKRQRERLQTILQQIRAKGLSAHDEVIETYNALMAVFQAGEHRREEWLPPEEFSIQIARAIPALRRPFEDVTMRFSRTLYGEKSVGEDDLLLFRENVARILKFFQVPV